MKSGSYPRFPTRGEQVVIGALVSIAAFAVFQALSGCGSSLSSAVIQCKIEAIDKLPDDPFAVNGQDVANLIARLQSCSESNPDAGQ